MTDELRSTAFGGYGRGPRELIRDSGLAPAARLLWIVLEDMTSGNSPRPYPGQEKLAGYVGCSERHVRRLLGDLEDAGWLMVTRRGVTQTNLYTLTRPDQARTSVSDGQSDRTSVSGHDRTSVSGQERTSVSYKAKPAEAEPEEAPLPSTARQEGDEIRADGGEAETYGFQKLTEPDHTAVAAATAAGWTPKQIAATAEQCRTNPEIRSPRAVWRHRLTNEDPPATAVGDVTATIIAWTARGKPQGELNGPAAELYAANKAVRDACRNGTESDIRSAVRQSVAA